MKTVAMEDFEKLGINRYQAVIIASQHARYLNAKRLQQLEQLEEDPSIDFDARKITMVSLKDLLESKIKFKL